MNDLLTNLRRLSVSAGREIMAVYAADAMATQTKADSSPVTEADLRADAVIRAGLSEAFPDLPAVTEEHAASHGAPAGDSFFLVDPLDGTKEFIQRRGEFTVNIALIRNGAPVAGVVYAPAIGRLFAGEVGVGAWEEQGDFDLDSPGETRPIAAREADNAALAVVASKSHRDAATDAYIARYNAADFKSAGSSLKFCLVAAGEADLYPRLGPTMEWDTAAGHAVLAAAGGAVDRFDDAIPGAPLRYGKAGFKNPFFIAYGPGVALTAD